MLTTQKQTNKHCYEHWRPTTIASWIMNVLTGCPGAPRSPLSPTTSIDCHCHHHHHYHLLQRVFYHWAFTLHSVVHVYKTKTTYWRWRLIAVKERQTDKQTKLYLNYTPCPEKSKPTIVFAVTLKVAHVFLWKLRQAAVAKMLNSVV